MTDIIKIISEILKVNDTNTFTTTIIVVISILLYFVILHAIKIYTKSNFEKCFLSKDQ